MRQSLAKSARRDLRRALGEAGVERIEAQTVGLARIEGGLAAVRADVAALSRDHVVQKKLVAESQKALIETVVGHTNHLTVIEHDAIAFQEATRTVWGRICWVCGR